MDKDKTTVFIGHSDCPLSVEDIIPFVEQEIMNGVDTFLNGGQGAFDRIAAGAVCKLKEKYPHIKNILVIPYHNFRIFDKALFDEIITPDNSNSVSYRGFKTAIPKRNSYLIENSYAAICYVNHISAGAYKTYQLAKKKKLRIINISDEIKRHSYERKNIMQAKFVSVTTDLLALAYLSQQNASAYEISKFIEEHSTEETAISQNSVYTSLYKLSQNGYVQSETITTETGTQREIYSILSKGKIYYESLLNDYMKHIQSVNQILSVII